jgi:hypothetical protein
VNKQLKQELGQYKNQTPNSFQQTSSLHPPQTNSRNQQNSREIDEATSINPQRPNSIVLPYNPSYYHPKAQIRNHHRLNPIIPPPNQSFYHNQNSFEKQFPQNSSIHQFEQQSFVGNLNSQAPQYNSSSQLPFSESFQMKHVQKKKFRRPKNEFFSKRVSETELEFTPFKFLPQTKFSK